MPRNLNARPGPKSKQSSKDPNSFHSPESNVEQTDYELQYTSRNRSTRHSGRTPLGQSSSGKRSSTPTTPNKNRSSERRSSPAQNNNSSPRAGPISPKKNSRKQANPMSRIQIMWKQIKELQRRTDNLTPKAPFGRVIRDILIAQSSVANRITLTALEALQTSSEIYLTNLFTDAYVCTLHRKRVTLGVHDLRLVRFLRGPTDTGNK